MNDQFWTKDGKRKGMLYGKCKKAHTIHETNGKTYCYGYIDTTNDEPIDICEDCIFNVRNRDDYVFFEDCQQDYLEQLEYERQTYGGLNTNEL